MRGWRWVTRRRQTIERRASIMTRLKFTKMQGLGNDFVVLDGLTQSITMHAALARRLADRHFGIGCDQILLVEPATTPTADFRYRIWNADGGEVEQCGNGARCFARFVFDQGLVDRGTAGLKAQDGILVETKAGLIAPRLEADGQVSVDMGFPVFAPAEVPFLVGDAAPTPASTYALSLPAGTPGTGAPDFPREIEISVLSMGNPHAVQLVADVDTAPVTTQGPLIEQHARFPRRVNVGYMQVLARDAIRLRVWERGAGETLACGTGACAAVVAGIQRGLLDTSVRVQTRGGELRIHWSGQSVTMTGPAVTVFHGEIELDESR
jgi:diaminopimelate epimerase